MISSIIKKIKQKFCIHKFKTLGEEKYIDITMNWIGTLQPQFEQLYECTKCGKRKKKVYIYYGNIKNPDGSYNFNQRRK